MERKLLHTPEGVRDIYNGECTQKLYIQDKICLLYTSDAADE